MKKKVLAVLLTAAMAATVLAGCGGSSSSDTASSSSDAASTESAASSGDAELTMDWWGGDSRHEATIAAVEQFEANTGITVATSYNAWSGWETAKAAEYISGNNPDVQQTNFDWINKYDADGTTFLDLNEVSDILDLTQWSDNDLEIVKDVNGGIAGVPVSLTGRTFYWNETTYAAAGLAVPETLADLLAAGPVFLEQLGEDYYPLVIGEYDRMILMTYYLQAKYGTPIINEAGNLTFTQDQLQEGLEFIQSLEDAHVTPTCKAIEDMAYDSIDKAANFMDGHLAGIFEWDTAAGKYMNALDEDQTLVVGHPFEDMGGEGAVGGTGSFTKVAQMFSISADTQHKEEAAQLLNYLLNEEEGVKLMGTERGIPESKAALAVLEAEGMIDETSMEAHNAVMDSDPYYWNPLFDDAKLKGDSGAYKDILNGFSYGDYTVEEAAELLYEAMVEVAPAAN